MSAQNSIALTSVALPEDFETPATLTLLPKGVFLTADRKSIANWRSGSLYSGFPTGQVSLTEQHSNANANGIEKFRYVLEVPVMTEDPSSGIASKALSGTAVVEFWLHKDSPPELPATMADVVSKLTAGAYLQAAIANREAAW